MFNPNFLNPFKPGYNQDFLKSEDEKQAMEKKSGS
jgi:hypothetical protein